MPSVSTRKQRPGRGVRTSADCGSYGSGSAHAGDKLIPAFADAAVGFRGLERETAAAVRKGEGWLVPTSSVTKRVEAEVERLFSGPGDGERTAISLTRQNVGMSPEEASWGTFGQLARTIELEQKLDVLPDTATEVRDCARDWRERAEADAKRNADVRSAIAYGWRNGSQNGFSAQACA